MRRPDERHRRSVALTVGLLLAVAGAGLFFLLAPVRRRARRDRVHRARRTPDDRTLLDRVESELFLGHPEFKGRVNLDCEYGQVCLRGELPSGAAMQELIDAVSQVDGVADVRSLLHVTGTPAPNKEAALRAGGAPLSC